MGKKVIVSVGTSKGGFTFTSSPDRKAWQSSDILFKSWKVMHMKIDPRDQRLHAAASHFVYGPTTHYSDDFGQTWTQARQSPAIQRLAKFGRPPTVEDVSQSASPAAAADKLESMIKVWNITPGRASEPGVLYAGAEPASLFKSTDRGESWQLVDGLFDHPQRAKWFPGNGGLCLHTILLDPANPDRMYVGISTGGCYRTDDGGQTWAPYNKNVRADFSPDPYPEYGQCCHKMIMHPDQPNMIYQQNHCGVYRSDDLGQNWIDIGGDKLPSRFGFPVAVHPHDPSTVYVVLEQSDVYHMSIDSQLAVWRSRDRGENWERLTKGLPGQAHLVVLREAMTTDDLDEAGIYMGTNTGQLFFSRDAGDHWELLADYLPPIQSVEAQVVTE